MLGAMLRAFEELEYTNTDTVVVTGIGCTGKADDIWRPTPCTRPTAAPWPIATGIKAFNPRLHVVVLMGDGDSVTIGGNHFIHAARRNIDLTAIVINNFNYGMTGGQVSGTTPGGSFTSTTAWGNPERDFDICALAAGRRRQLCGPGDAATTAGSSRSGIKEALSRRDFRSSRCSVPVPPISARTTR